MSLLVKWGAGYVVVPDIMGWMGGGTSHGCAVTVFGYRKGGIGGANVQHYL